MPKRRALGERVPTACLLISSRCLPFVQYPALLNMALGFAVPPKPAFVVKVGDVATPPMSATAGNDVHIASAKRNAAKTHSTLIPSATPDFPAWEARDSRSIDQLHKLFTQQPAAH